MTTDARPKTGLEETVATSSAICYLDGDRGVLAYCGYDIHELAAKATFEEVCYLLWHRRLPNRAELGDLQSQLAQSRSLPEPVLRLMHSLLAAGVVDGVRMLVCPSSRGKGTRVFEDRQDLTLVEAAPFQNGIVLLRYEIRT